MEQLVARRAHNPKVSGSSPDPATNLYTVHLEDIIQLLPNIYNINQNQCLTAFNKIICQITTIPCILVGIRKI